MDNIQFKSLRSGNLLSKRIISLLFFMISSVLFLYAQANDLKYEKLDNGHIVSGNIGAINGNSAFYRLKLFQNNDENITPNIGLSIMASLDAEEIAPYHNRAENSSNGISVNLKIVLSNGEVLSTDNCNYTTSFFENLAVSILNLKSNRKTYSKDREYAAYIINQLSTYDIKNIEVIGLKHSLVSLKTSSIIKSAFSLLADKSKIVWTTSAGSTSHSNNPPASEYPLTIMGSTSYRLTIPGSGNADIGDALSVRTRTGKLVSDAGLPDFQVTSDSYWARIGLQSDAAFMLYADANNTGSPRTATITVSVEGHSTSMTVYQPCNIITIKKVWTEYDKWRNMQKGILIHTNFVVNGVRGQQGDITAFFFFQNGQRLNDYNNNYRSLDGQVATGGAIVPSYDGTEYHDYELFIPYYELHTNGVADLMFTVQVTIGGQQQRSEYFSFTIR